MTKKIKITFSFLILMISLLCITSCLSKNELPNEITVDDKTYICMSEKELFPTIVAFDKDGMVSIHDRSFHKYNEANFDCYITSDANAKPTAYFLDSEYEDAKAYYNNWENFDFYYSQGNIHDTTEYKVYSISKMDYTIFQRLYDFAAENGYKPSSPFDKKEGLKEIVIDEESRTDFEMHFYYESKDKSFTSEKHLFRLIDNKLCLVYCYNCSTGATKLNYYELPSDLNDYFCNVIKETLSAEK